MNKEGEIFLSEFVQVLFQQLVSGVILAWAQREKIESHFKKLSQSFQIILRVLEDAQEKQLMENSVRVWLEDLRDLAYDLDDVLDEITTRYLIQEAKGIEIHKRSGAWKFIPTCCGFAPGALIIDSTRMYKIKEITNRLLFLVEQRSDLALRENFGGSSTQPAPMTLSSSTSLVHEAHVYGRDEDKKTILEMLLKDETCHEKISVISIVGMGGIGKTTLAQQVYNDRDVEQNFLVKAWVYVSVEFDVFAITKTIFKAVTGMYGESMDLDMLQASLKDTFSKSKFLIVLDDVWSESYEKWEILLRPFQFGLPGSRIIVTTRTDAVASVVGSPRTAYYMKLLTNEDCLALLAQHSRTSLDENPELKNVGVELARRCKGLPLAAKTLGGLLRSKETVEDWDGILKSKIWDFSEENNIPPVLRLSYHHLPSHLKHLFVYCSIFPKDYIFDKNELVLLWMGEGFLEKPNGWKTKEELGHEYFNELLSRSFFQRLSGSESLFVMHDLIHDLAHFVAGGTCFRLDEEKDIYLEYRLPVGVRHVSFLRHEYEAFKKFKTFSDVRGLRTFLPMPVQGYSVWPPFYLSNKILVELVPRLLSLRVLSLSGYAITELPSTICNLIRLRYLNLSSTSIVTLPESLSDLYCLETLSLSNCLYICNLPLTIGNLKNLRHLDISDTEKLKDMPAEIGNLEKLQTLPKIVLSRTGGGLGLKELRKLKNLRGKLAILELHNITDIEHVKEASMRCKNNLDELDLIWGNDIDNPRDRSSEEEVLDYLEPHENLQKLRIEFYGGLSFPSWIGNRLFRKLSSIMLRSCTECTSLPPLGLLPELKELYIREMPKIKCIGIEFNGNGDTLPFHKLEILRFYDMPAWEKWSNGDDSAPIRFLKLRQLAILKCENLTNVSPLSFPVLHDLDLEECNNVVLERFCNLELLSYLRIESVTGISHIPRALMQSLSALEFLECCTCKELLSLWPNEVPVNLLTRLRRLVIADCSQLVSIGEGKEQLPCNLEVLKLFRCGNLTSLPNDCSLGSLRELIITDCPRYSGFPENGIPPMLKRLEILTCNALESLPNNARNLEQLEINHCSSLKTWGTSHFPTNLKKLTIKHCNRLDSVSDPMFSEDVKVSLEELNLCEWLNFSNLLQHLSGFSNLVRLYLKTCSSLRHFPESALPPHLRALLIEDCASLKSLPSKMGSMTSLASLEIRSCPRLDNFPEFDLPPSLSSLRIWDSKRFKPLSEWGFHRLSSLREVSIYGGFRDLKVLGDDCIFPPSLINLTVDRFPELHSLSRVLENLTSLRHLSIMDCAKLKDLPSDKLLENLWDLKISECAVLIPKCVKDRGEYWSKISGIPCVEIDGRHVY